jgi:hypothetical protein
MSHTMTTHSETRIAELEARIAAKLKKENESNGKLPNGTYPNDKKFSSEYLVTKAALRRLLANEDQDIDEDIGMTPEELQIDFWDNMGEMWGYDIIGSESHPLKKAFELYCEMKKERMKEDEDEALTKEETKALGESLFAQIKALDVTADHRNYMLWTEDDRKSGKYFASGDIWCIEDLRSDLFLYKSRA